MRIDEPPQSWQEKQHQRIRQHHATAFAELCEEALPHLVIFLSLKFPRTDRHIHESAAIDCLLSYYARPQQYDPGQLSLFAFLRMASDRDLRNALDKEQRRQRRLVETETSLVEPQLVTEHSLSTESELNDWLAEHTSMSKEEVITTFLSELGPTDQQILEMMLDGVRETEAYAAVMGMSEIDPAAQRRLVKRAKDRLKKKVQRFGQQVRR